MRLSELVIGVIGLGVGVSVERGPMGTRLNDPISGEIGYGKWPRSLVHYEMGD